MGCDINPRSIKWESFVAANEKASDTVALFMELANSDQAEVRPERWDSSFTLAEDAAEVYQDFRDALSKDEREKWDLLLYAGWWIPSDEVLDETPLLKSINTEAIELKGPHRHALIRALSPQAVAQVANASRSASLTILLEAMNESSDDYGWPDSFGSAEAVCDYLELWGEVFALAADDGLGIVVHLHC
jgi:hypothetical protein